MARVSTDAASGGSTRVPTDQFFAAPPRALVVCRFSFLRMNKVQPTAPTVSLLSGGGQGGAGPTKSNRAKAGAGRTRRSRKLRPRQLIWLGVALVVVVVLVAVLLSRGFDWSAVNRAIAGFNSAIVILLMAVLPLAGFPISLVYLMAGARFGPWLGIPVVILVTAMHLLGTYWITRSFLRGPIERFLARRSYRLPHVPEGEYGSVCLLAALVPGPPYFARNYLLALTDIPLRLYFWVCLSVYVVRSIVAIMIGDLASDPDTGQLLLLVGVYVLKLGICAYVVWRLRRVHQRRAAAKRS
jgi:uncharacterized membrane protein YdjX (TVP38/TMEM64 family)